MQTRGDRTLGELRHPRVPPTVIAPSARGHQEAAVRDERLAINPARGVDLPRIADEEARFLTPDELLGLEDAIDPRYAVLVPFVADTGLRIG
ncbi:MAG: hypothetical protein ACXVLZ_09435 [Acidimicrobiia bacterium]